MKFLKHVLMNEASDFSAGGGDGLDVSTIGASSDSSESNDFQIGSDTDAMKAYGLDPEKYGLDKKVAESPKEESQGSDEIKADSQETDEKPFLDFVNSLGAIHSDLPIKIENKDELKNLIQKGKDYTLKTQSLSEERKALELERTQTNEELNAAINEFKTSQEGFSKQMQELEQWTFALNELRESAPDVFEEVQRTYSGVQKQFSNPIINQQLQSFQREIDEVKKGLSQRENKLIVDEFEREKGSLSATEQSMKELGLNIEWDKVKAEWAATGQPLKNVVGSLYFDQMAKVQASKSKVETIKAKVESKPVGIGNKSRSGSKAPTIDPGLKGFDRAMALYKQLQN